MEIDYKVQFNAEGILKGLGLDEKGRVQQAIDNQFLMGVEPYTPFLEGYLIASGHIEEPGLLKWNVGSKARRLYYGEMDWKWSNGGVQEGGLRGPYWAERYIQNGGREQIERVARSVVGK